MHAISLDNYAAVSLADKDDNIFVALESEVRTYCRSFPAIFKSAKGPYLVAEDGTTYIDFFCGASSLNYGHNNDRIKKRLVNYLQHDGLMHALDMHTTAKREFLTRFRDVILLPRGLSYKVQFCGPTGTDAVEAALKLARKATGRTGVIAFSGAYHGMSAGSLSATGSASARKGAGIPLVRHFVPAFRVGPLGKLRLDRPAKQDPFRLVLWCRRPGCRRSSNPFRWKAASSRHRASGSAGFGRSQASTTSSSSPMRFSRAADGRARSSVSSSLASSPDLVTLSKSISGYGLPMSILLIRPDLDVWRPGEHTGTFRGNQLSFVAADRGPGILGGSGVPGPAR